MVFAVSSYGLNTIRSSTDTVVEKSEHTNHLAEIRALVVSEWQWYTDYALAHDEGALARARATGQEVVSETQELRGLLADEERATLDSFLVSRQGFVQEIEAMASDYVAGDTAGGNAKPVRKGFVSAEAASRMSDAECVDLIFMPGTSTAERATEVSGRGVGMDIVRTNVEAINGFVTLDSRVGEGIRFTLSLPLTLATLQALLVSLDQAVYAIPLVHVLETIRLGPGDTQTVGGREVIRLRENVLPLLRLSTALGFEETRVSGQDCGFAIVVHFGERLVGLAVGSLMESQEIVFKSLGRYIGDIRGIAGASILGDGRVVLILDIPTLINAVRSRVA